MVSIRKVYAITYSVYVYVFPYLVLIKKKIVRNDANDETFHLVMWLKFTYWRLKDYFLDYSIKQSKQNNNKLFAGKTFLAAVFSSNVNEGIKAVLFFKRKDFTRTKSTKTHISKQKQKRQRFFAVQKHLRGRKLLSRLFVFLCFLCAFCAFLCVKQKRQYFYAHKNI